MNAPGPQPRSRRAIIDSRAVGLEIAAAAAARDSEPQVRAILSRALVQGRAEIARRLLAEPDAGERCAHQTAFLTDEIVRLVHDHVTTHRFPVANRSAGERLAVAAVGGYGRGEMAPFSDVDIAFLTPTKRTAWTEQVVEAVLYLLWDLKLTVGHSSRSLDEMVALARQDLTIRTAMLESRFIVGDEVLFEEAKARFWAKVVHGSVPDFVRAKMAERDARHARMGDSRYVVEPNVKDGKGGLRDLHALYWIGKYIHRVRAPRELVEVGLLTASEYRKFARAERFFWAVRCHLHMISGRAEERLTFEYQREVAARMAYADRPGKSAVERFMHFYFLQAKTVGDLTGLFLAHLDATHGARWWRLPTLRRSPRKLNGFVIESGRLAIPDETFFAAEPVRLLELFQLADLHGLEIHSRTMRQARLDAPLIDSAVREDARTNELFLDVLTSPRDPERVLRWMNETSVLGRFIPDFGRVVGQMQFDMYHHFTVDEHTLRAIGLLSSIEKGELKEDHPLATAMLEHVASRRVLYLAVLLHDIAKGRGGDHRVLGARVARRLCPRLGLDPAETDTVAWLVRHHLLMSATAFKRDLSDPKTIADFAGQVQSLSRLRLLLALTIVDIRAVGPNVWNGWKRQLLRELFDAAEELLRLGHKQRGREERIEARQAQLRGALDLSMAQLTRLARRLPEAYWIAETDEVIARNAALLLDARPGTVEVAMGAVAEREATIVTVLAPDEPGLFARVAGAISGVGCSIIDARVHTTTDRLALDNLLVQDMQGLPLAEDRIARVEAAIRAAISSRAAPKTPPPAPSTPFRITPSVLFDPAASNRFNVVEVTAHDRPALLHDLTQALFKARMVLHSAHVATYGERAVDTFYLTDRSGAKVASKARLTALSETLRTAASGG